MHAKNIHLIALILASTFATPLWAHGDAAHVQKNAVTKKEQKDWGIAGNTKAAQRSIAVGMGDDMRFTPGQITVKLGETVKFTIKNTGQMLHEFVIGTKQELDAHAALMLKFPNMEHSEAYMAHVPPGKTGHIIWTFNRVGDFGFACLMAGHYQAGMVGHITVLATK